MFTKNISVCTYDYMYIKCFLFHVKSVQRWEICLSLNLWIDSLPKFLIALVSKRMASGMRASQD